MTIDFGPDQAEALGRLAQSLDMTKAAAIRAGLALLQIAVREARKGRSIGIVDGERVVSEVAGAWSDLVPAA